MRRKPKDDTTVTLTFGDEVVGPMSGAEFDRRCRLITKRLREGRNPIKGEPENRGKEPLF